MNLTFTNLFELLLIAAIIIAIGIPLFGKMPNTRPFSEIDPVEEEFKHLLVRKEEILLYLSRRCFNIRICKSNECRRQLFASN